QAPHLGALAEHGVVFDNAYCNSPLCAPARFSLMAGQLCSHIGAYDNAAEFQSDIPTFAHYLRHIGYRTALSGKMHFVGPDQLHGFEERLTTDIYPADFGWTPDWSDAERRWFWFHNMQSVVEAGIYERTLELDYDDEVHHTSTRFLYDVARDADPRPFFFTVSFIQPHDPYMTPQRYWDRYDHAQIDMPAVPAMARDVQDPHSRRLFDTCHMDQYRIDDEHIRNARHAYYGMISWLDDRVGQLRKTLMKTGLDDDTIIIVTADHGDMLGERGLWYKMSFFERSVRVPLIVHGPRWFAAQRVDRNVSHVDLLPTLTELATDGAGIPPAAPVDGESLLPLLDGRDTDWPDVVFAEYLAEGTQHPIFMVKRGDYKLVQSATDPIQLFDLGNDPHELDNIANDANYASTRSELCSIADKRWPDDSLRQQIIDSQQRRLFLQKTMHKGRETQWDFQPTRDPSRQYNRNYANELYEADRRARIPYRDPPPAERQR
ncbi:MAG: choline-sulfatase, partial [Gammaproteobacteria bacterium]|nr:choline-sulfatase [Gammaproteobacteria bacterium]